MITFRDVIWNMKIYLKINFQSKNSCQTEGLSTIHYFFLSSSVWPVPSQCIGKVGVRSFNKISTEQYLWKFKNPKLEFIMSGLSLIYCCEILVLSLLISPFFAGVIIGCQIFLFSPLASSELLLSVSVNKFYKNKCMYTAIINTGIMLFCQSILLIRNIYHTNIYTIS